MSNLTSTLATITSDAFDSVEANAKALNNQNDSYHLQRSINKFGEAATHIEATKILSKEENIPFTEAATKVSTVIEYNLRTTEGNKLFKKTHHNLQKEG